MREQLENQFSAEFETMYQLLTHDKEFSIRTEHQSPVMIGTAEKGYSNIVKKLVTIGFNPNSRGARQETLLHIFAHHGDGPMIGYLLSHGLVIDARDKHNRTALHWAAWAGREDAVSMLLSRKANVNAVDREGRTPLYGAAGGCYIDVVRLLLSFNGDKNIRGGTDKETPLERARKKRNNELVELLSG